MSWRAESTFVSEKADAEKNFLKAAKKLREICKLELQAHVEANQQAKVEQKPALLEELAALKVDRQFWEKFDDIWALLPPGAVSKIEARKAAADAEEKRKKDERRAMATTQTEDIRRVPDLNFVCRHERPVTDLCYDEKTGYLYSSSKDKAIVRWNVFSDKCYAESTLCGHEGAVWCVDVHKEEVISGGADGLLIFWSSDPKAATKGRGKEKIQQPSRVVEYGGIIKGLRVADSGICLWTDRFGPRSPAHLALLDRNDPKITLWKTYDLGSAKINMLLWAPVGNPKIFSAHDDGTLSIWAAAGDADNVAPATPTAGAGAANGNAPSTSAASTTSNPDGSAIRAAKLMKTMKPHEKAIISMNTHKNYILTASSDMTVKAINAGSPALPTVFHCKANRPLRAVAAWDFPEDRCFGFVYGGGRDPKDVTTSYLLPDEFDFYQSYVGEQTSTIMTRNGAAGPLHRLIWRQEISKVFAASEDGEVKMWCAETLTQMR